MVGNNQDFCHDCQVSCNSYNYGPCVFWRGPAVSYFRIPNWKEENNFSLQEAVTNIANKTAEYVNLNLVEAPYYFKDTQVNPGPAAQLALEILKSLNTDDVVVKNSLLTLGRTSSVYSMNLGTRPELWVLFLRIQIIPHLLLILKKLFSACPMTISSLKAGSHFIILTRVRHYLVA